jgi:hypothetical protein
MWLTTSFLDVRRGDLEYLFFLLTEDYIEGNVRIAGSLGPLLERFARDLGSEGAVVRPFAGDASKVFGEAANSKWPDRTKWFFHEKTPGLLIIAEDFRQFDPDRSTWVFVSFRSSMTDTGDIKVFEMQEALQGLLAGVQRGDLLERCEEYVTTRSELAGLSEAFEVRPGAFGISVDFRVLSRWVRE